jgi:hypothetical protein
LFQVSGESFTQFLEEYNLLFNYEVPLETDLVTLISTVTSDMQSSASQYQFATIPRRATSQNLLLLGLVNRGQGRGPSRQSYLKPWPLSTGTPTTIRNLAQDRYNFSNPLCIHRENRFVIYLGIVSIFPDLYLCIDKNFTLAAASRSPLVHVENDRQHTCLWSKLTHLFPGDSEFGEEDNSWCESEGEPCDGSTGTTQAGSQSGGHGHTGSHGVVDGRISPLAVSANWTLRQI